MLNHSHFVRILIVSHRMLNFLLDIKIKLNPISRCSHNHLIVINTCITIIQVELVKKSRQNICKLLYMQVKKDSFASFLMDNIIIMKKLEFLLIEIS